MHIDEAADIRITDHYATSKMSNGFKGANIADMVAKKAMTKCVKKHRFKHCRKCKGCLTPNCGKCRNCLDMPAFGGFNIVKQKCVDRVCTNPVMFSCEYCKFVL